MRGPGRFHLTQDEATSGASIALGFKNAVVVMPEGSRLRIAINGESVVDTPISSPNDIKRMTAAIRPGLLRPGQNIIRTEAFQRHRTDCTIDATYELWTDLDSATTKLVFAEGAAKTLRGLDDLPAVGVDSTGVTTIRVVAPKIYRPEIRDRLLRLVQLVALRGRYAHPVIQVVESDPGPSPVGTIKVAMGLAGELRGLVPGMPDAASTQPLTMMMQEPGSLGSTLVVVRPDLAGSRHRHRDRRRASRQHRSMSSAACSTRPHGTGPRSRPPSALNPSALPIWACRRRNSPGAA